MNLRDLDYCRRMKRCICCDQPYFCADPNGPVPKEEVKFEDFRPGLIYSEAGMKEVNISGMCEYCFNKTTGA